MKQAMKTMQIKQILNVPFHRIFIYHNIKSLTGNHWTIEGKKLLDGKDFFCLRQKCFPRDIKSIITVVDLQFETE